MYTTVNIEKTRNREGIDTTTWEALMKWHRFFGWAGAICMALALYTGYKHK